jgi:hypothetical protein
MDLFNIPAFRLETRPRDGLAANGAVAGRWTGRAGSIHRLESVQDQSST